MAEVLDLPPLEVTASNVREAVSSVLHTILFCRLLGAVQPVDKRAWGLTYATVGDPAVDAAVDAKAASVEAWASTHVGRRAGVRLALYEQAGGSGRPPWETWVLPLAVVAGTACAHADAPDGAEPAELGGAGPPASPGGGAHRVPSQTQTQTPPPGRGRVGLEAVLLAAASAAAARREAVPPVLTPSVATFPFTIDLVTVPASSSSSSPSFSLGAVKRLLLQASPPSVLH